MDMDKWGLYEAEKRDIRKNYKRKRVAVWFIWLVAAAVLNTALIILKDKMGVAVMFTIMIVANGFALFLTCRKNAEIKMIEKNQLALHEQNEPFERFRT